MLAKDHAVIDTHTHMCLERMRPLGSCLVTFPDSFTAQEGWIEREEEEKRDCGGKRAFFFFFFTATGSVTAPDSVCISSSCSTSLDSVSRHEDSSPPGNKAERIQLKNNIHRAKLPFIASLKPVYA